MNITSGNLYITYEDNYAIVHHKENRTYYRKGKLHREDGPAMIWANGYNGYYQNGLLHRDDGPAQIYSNGSEEYYEHGMRHRIDGPAIILYRSDSSHFNYRTYQMLKNFNTYTAYYIHGKKLTKEEFDMYNFVDMI